MLIVKVKIDHIFPVQRLYAISRSFVKTGLLLIISLLFYNASKAQKFGWEVTLYGFADNREYKSSVQIPQTFMGTLFTPEVGLQIDSLSAIRVGATTLFEFGSNQFQDKVYPQLYYSFCGSKFKFLFGAFSRHKVFDNAPAALYYDSLYYFRPYINGLFWTYNGNSFRQSVYLDWTSRQTQSIRETFIMGGEGQCHFGDFFLHHHLYMYHYAKTASPSPNEFIRDNGALYLLVGYDLTQKLALDSLCIGVGGIQSYERSRNDMVWHTPYGFLFEVLAQYKGFGIKNIFYYGKGHALDWGDPFYRLKQYDRFDIYFTPLRLHGVEGRFGISMHFAENRISHQQQFYLRVNIGSFAKKKLNHHPPEIW
ncbi:MAG: hypothetical protein BWX49_00763 [Bacteroidetes bacterium ADurb.Bin008]|nr:MAG: hypothetical protein BWX49_00763 [Bacteroidetes bacterium ADurb.Bin008]